MNFKKCLSWIQTVSGTPAATTLRRSYATASSAQGLATPVALEATAFAGTAAAPYGAAYR